MINSIASSNFASVAAATVLGYGPGQQTPVDLLVCTVAGFNVTLPPLTSSVPQPPTIQQTTVGTGGGYRLTVFNQAASGAVTLVPAGTDVIVGTVSLAAQNSKVTLQAAPSVGTWFVVA